MHPSLFSLWFFWPAALFLATLSPPARGSEPTDTVNKEDTPREKRPQREREGLAPTILEFSLGPEFGSYKTEQFVGAQLALRGLVRVSDRHLVGLMLEWAVTLDMESSGQSILGIVGYRYVHSRGVSVDLLPVYSRTQYNDGLIDDGLMQGEIRYARRTWIAPKVRISAGGTVGGTRIGVSFEAVVDLSFQFGINLFIGGIP